MRTGTVSELLKLSTVSAVTTDEADHKKFSVRCHLTDPEKLPLPKRFLLVFLKKIIFYFVFSDSVFQFLLYFPSRMCSSK